MIWDPVVTLLHSVLTDPTLGIPVVVTVAALGGWIAWSPPMGEVRPPMLRRSWFEPESDLASQVYYALLDGQYSRVISAAAGRLDESLRRTRGLSLYDLPWSDQGGREAGLVSLRPLRRTLKRLTRAHAESLEREGRFFIRWRFWLSREVDRREYLLRVDRAVAEAAGWVQNLEGRA